MANPLKAVDSPWDVVPAFTLDEGTGRVLKVSVTFDDVERADCAMEGR